MNKAHHPNKGPFLRTLKPGDQFVGFYVIRSKQLEPFRDASRGNFLSLVLSDGSGQLLARVWEGAEEALEDIGQAKVGKLRAEVETYLDRTQIRVLQIRPATDDEFDPQDMLPSSERTKDEMLAELDRYIEKIQQPELRQLLDTLFGDNDFRADFAIAPAARRVHHAYLGGLIEHTLELAKIAETVLEVFPKLNKDLLLTGVLLHDIGKVHEFMWEYDIDYSTEGRLFGHIVMADEMLRNAIDSIKDFPQELTLQLRHMLLAHHGRYEWGSPRRPKTIEAIALHQIENLGAQINRFGTLLDDRPDGEAWTSYDRMLNRQLYGGIDDDLNVEELGLIE
ncbi:MAG: HD domain-containing protein [Chloroflexota bacterium]